MATQLPISTISYNTEGFLREQLDAWIKAHYIQAYQYICHKGEDGDKDHIHLRIEPNKKLDMMDLTEKLKQWEKGKDKPLGVRPWRPSKEEDWYLYVVHDPEYMSIKYSGMDKGEKIPYEWEKIQVSEDYDLETAFIRAKATLNHSSAQMVDKLKDGAKPSELISLGYNPYLVNAVYKALFATDYSRVVKELDNVRQRLQALEDAVDEYGLTILADDLQVGKLKLEKIDNPFEKENE